MFAIDFDEKTVRVARTLNLIAGDGQTNVLHLNTLDFSRWNEITKQESAYQIQEKANNCYREAQRTLVNSVGSISVPAESVSVRNISTSFYTTGRLDAEYYQPKYDALFTALSTIKTKKLGGAHGIVNIEKSIEPGSEVYVEDGIPFVRVSDVSKFEISEPEVKLRNDILPNPEVLFPQKDTILLSKDGSVGIAYKTESTMPVITSGALNNWKIDHGKTILKGWFLAKLKLQNGTAEDIKAGAGSIEEVDKGFDFEVTSNDDFSIAHDSESNTDRISIQLQGA